jgi:GNAT superfamily N-acetyltransferase
MRQYGCTAALAQIVLAAVRPVYQVDSSIAFIILDFQGYAFSDSRIVSLTFERIQQAADEHELRPHEINLLSGFLREGCRGVCAEVDGGLAGYGFVQFEGDYRFGHVGSMRIPEHCAVLKNLFVFPRYRGRRLHQKLSEALLSLVPPDWLPCGLIIPENRIAVRNWEKCGFQRVFEVSHRRWLGGQWQMRINRLAECSAAEKLERAMVAGHDACRINGYGSGI